MHKSVKFVFSAGLAATTGAVLFLSGFYPAVGQEKEKGDGQPKTENEQGANLVNGYKKWAKVNPKPILMQPAAAAQCASPSPGQQFSPHLQKFITVYVNKLGKDAMMLKKNPHFPVGTVIVKEKLSKLDSKSPELMTVMMKREKGYNPDSGDWEYLLLDGTGKKVQAQGKLEKCQSCHNEYPAREADHVFRAFYLPRKVKTALK